MKPWNTKDHHFVSDPNQDHAYSYCQFCDSVVGYRLGSEHVTECNEHFDQKKFESWLNWHNMSQTKDGKYVKRFTSEEMEEGEIMAQYMEFLEP